MSEITNRDRFEELEAGRALGDLDASEWEEWKELVERRGLKPDGSLELLAAAVEERYHRESGEALPEELRKRILEMTVPSEERRPEDAEGLGEAEKRLGALTRVIETSAWPVVATDMAGLVVAANQNMIAVCGHRVDDLMGRKPGAVLQGTDTTAEMATSARRAVGEVLGGGEAEFGIVNHDADGLPYHVMVSIRQIEGYLVAAESCEERGFSGGREDARRELDRLAEQFAEAVAS